MSHQHQSHHFSGEIIELPASSAGHLLGTGNAISNGVRPDRNRIALRLAETHSDRSRATDLLNKRFSWRGYGSDHHIPDQDSHTTFLALVGEEVAGTVTLGIDSSHGLAIDSLFKDEIDVFRNAPGSQVCELVKLAFEAELPDQQSLAMLFHAVFLYGSHNHECTDLFIEVNPRHRRFYQTMLGFTPIGIMKNNPTVGAPSQLMWLNVSDIACNIAEYRRTDRSKRTRSLYSLFLSQAEESVVRDNLIARERSGSLHGINLIERSLSTRDRRPDQFHRHCANGGHDDKTSRIVA